MRFLYPNAALPPILPLTMKLLLTVVLAMAALAAGAYANDGDNGLILVPNSHGGYAVVQTGARAITIPFFGKHGYAAHVIAESHEKKKPAFILVPVSEDAGHGSKTTVYKKIQFGTAEEAEAAKSKQ
jgi:hypothetical protein